MNYRNDIDGLRAVAVIAVILFHLNPSSCSFGYLGVDVFFVISGFLITGIIQTKIDEERFSFKDFYIRRLRRLYPMLLTVVAVSAIAAIALLYGNQREFFVDSAVSALFAYSNIYHLVESQDYWSPTTKNMPLLHTWSLAVEEQYYILFPFVFYWLCKKVKLLGIRLLYIVVSTVVLYGIYIYYGYSGERFYLTHFRVWEFLIGSIAYYCALRCPFKGKVGYYGKLLALGGLITSLSVGVESSVGREVNILIALLSTSLILLIKSDEKCVTGQLLTLSWVQYIGKTSYSLYLWHWPVIVFYRIWNAPNYLIEAGLTLVLAAFSYTFVEQKYRYKTKPFVIFGSVSFLCVIGSLVSLKNVDLPFYVPNKFKPLMVEQSFKKAKEYEMLETLRDWKEQGHSELEQKYDVVLVGSSHARVFAKVFDEYSHENALSFLNLSASGLGVTTNTPIKRVPDAKQLNEYRNNILREVNASSLVIAGRWADEAENSIFLSELKKFIVYSKGVIKGPIYLIGQAPAPALPDAYKKDIRQFVFHQKSLNGTILLDADSEIVAINSKVKELCDNLEVIYIELDFPITVKGEIESNFAGGFIYADDNHLNEYGAECAFKEDIQPYLGKLQTQDSN